MILPNKFVKPSDSIVGISSSIISTLDKPITVSSLWEKTKAQGNINTYNKFVSALDLLFILGVITLDKGLIRRCVK